MADPILPFDVWPSSITQAATPANNNALRSEILNGDVISESTDAQPGSPSDGDIYIITGAATGAQWSTFDQYDLTIYKSGTWYAFAPVEGIVVNVAGVLKRWTGAAYASVGVAWGTITGTPTAPTAAIGTSTTQLATTEFVNHEWNPRYRFRAFSEMILGTGDGLHIASGVNGTGAARSLTANASTSEFGVMRFVSGTTTTGRGNVGSAGTGNAILLGLGQSYFYARAAIPTLSTGTETFTVRHGFVDSVSAEPTNGVYFRYTDGVNSGKWQAVTRSGGVETATDTGVSEVAATFRKFEITVNAGATSVEFKIGGSVVATNTTNIPSGVGKDVSYQSLFMKSAGTTSTSVLDVDTQEVIVDFTTPR